MTESVRKLRRWPWVLGYGTLFCAGIVGGVLISGAAQVHTFAVSCPPLFRPTPEEIAVTRGPGVSPPRGLERFSQLPRAGRIARVRGQVVVAARVEKDGSVSRTELVRSSGFCPYDVQALKDVKAWKFAPARRYEQAIAVWMPVTLNYSPDLQSAPAQRQRQRDGTNI